MRIPYTDIAIAIVIIVGFYKIGAIDKEIGNPLGVATGILVVAAYFLFPGGYLSLGLYALAAFVLLTIYKMVRGSMNH